MIEPQLNKLSASRSKVGLVVGLVIVIFVVVGVVVWILVRPQRGGVGTIGQLPLLGLREQPTSVELKSEYKNPFDRNAQYVNPFTDYKSPFISLQ